MQYSTEEVRNAMLRLRPLVEERIREWAVDHPDCLKEGIPMTTGFCRGIAAGVEEVLRERFPDWFWTVVGGHGVESYKHQVLYVEDAGKYPGGMVDTHGEWRGHFWVKGGDPDGDYTGLIIDLSADQFGYEDVVVTEQDDPRYREFWWLGVEDKVRPSERAWGVQLYAMWKLEQDPELRWQSLCA